MTVSGSNGVVTITGGARFFDGDKRDRGWARKVTRRAHAIGRLTVLDVETSEPPLAAFLTSLDKAPLRVQDTGSSGECYTFAWASGYENGSGIRIQGVLEGMV
jgi:hypothetical protein